MPPMEYDRQLRQEAQTVASMENSGDAMGARNRLALDAQSMQANTPGGAQAYRTMMGYISQQETGTVHVREDNNYGRAQVSVYNDRPDGRLGGAIKVGDIAQGYAANQYPQDQYRGSGGRQVAPPQEAYRGPVAPQPGDYSGQAPLPSVGDPNLGYPPAAGQAPGMQPWQRGPAWGSRPGYARGGDPLDREADYVAGLENSNRGAEAARRLAYDAQYMQANQNPDQFNHLLSDIQRRERGWFRVGTQNYNGVEDVRVNQIDQSGRVVNGYEAARIASYGQQQGYPYDRTSQAYPPDYPVQSPQVWNEVPPVMQSPVVQASIGFNQPWQMRGYEHEMRERQRMLAREQWEQQRWGGSPWAMNTNPYPPGYAPGYSYPGYSTGYGAPGLTIASSIPLGGSRHGFGSRLGFGITIPLFG